MWSVRHTFRRALVCHQLASTGDFFKQLSTISLPCFKPISVPSVFSRRYLNVSLTSNFALNSFQGGASGPSQDQVYEALEIFGEGIQDFDMMQTYGEEDGEVSRGYFPHLATRSCTLSFRHK